MKRSEPELWKRWNQESIISKKYYIDEVSDKEELSVKLSDDFGNRLLVTWDCFVESYMCSEEINRNKLYADTELNEWTFFEVKNSRYINWLCEESDNILILRNKNLYHICIIGINSVMDVVATDYPKIEIIK